jgi:hypothetical protein
MSYLLLGAGAKLSLSLIWVSQHAKDH